MATAAKTSIAIRRIRMHPYSGWVIGIGAFLLATLARSALSSVLSGVPFITYFPAVVIAGLFGGPRVGIAVFLLSFFTAWLLFIPPFGSLAIPPPPHRAALVLFGFGGALTVYCVVVLNRTVDQMVELQEQTETLFRELQHRVANNLAFISSIIHHQERQLERGSVAAQALADAQGRIATMGRVHRLLYDPRGIDRPVQAHLADVASELISASGRKVTVRAQGDGSSLDLRRLIPLALIASELVTNCLKHAFNDRQDGVIDIDFRQGEAHYTLRVADNGDGRMPAASADRKGLGTMIVDSLASQLHATVSVDRSRGTAVTVQFPADVSPRGAQFQTLLA